MTELIERKNILLKQAGDDLAKISEIGAICENAEFSSASAATGLIHLIGDCLGRITVDRYEMLHESNIALPEAEHGAEDGN
jgi:hypothetical protein